MDKYAYSVIEGIKCYNPQTALSNDYYPEEAYDELFKLERNNFWFRARNRLISYLFKKYVPSDEDLKTLEIGCGTGYVLSGLQKFTNLKLAGAEIFIRGLHFASKRLPGIEFFQLDAVNLPFTSEFDIICAFDVLEHIGQDEKTLKNIYIALKNNGLFFVSVPQHRFIWSAIDELSNHKRRYTKKELKEKLRKSGFDILYFSSFVFLLFPFMVISRFLNKKALPRKKDNTINLLHELKINPFLNYIFYLVMMVDELLIKSGIRLPFGGSLIGVAKKTNS